MRGGNMKEFVKKVLAVMMLVSMIGGTAYGDGKGVNIPDYMMEMIQKYNGVKTSDMYYYILDGEEYNTMMEDVDYLYEEGIFPEVFLYAQRDGKVLCALPYSSEKYEKDELQEKLIKLNKHIREENLEAKKFDMGYFIDMSQKDDENSKEDKNTEKEEAAKLEVVADSIIILDMEKEYKEKDIEVYFEKDNEKYEAEFEIGKSGKLRIMPPEEASVVEERAMMYIKLNGKEIEKYDILFQDNSLDVKLEYEELVKRLYQLTK